MRAPEAIFTGVEAVLFDLDGTLVDTNINFPAMKRAVLHHAQQAGASTANIEDFDILSIVDQAGRQLPCSGNLYVKDAWDLLEDIEMKHAWTARVKPHAPELLLDMASRGWRLGIVTRNCRRATDHLLTLLPDVFSATLAREDTPRVKPDPLHLTNALAQLDRPASSALMIGDHFMDIEAGKAAGLRSIALLYRNPAGHFDPVGPDCVFSDLAELHSALLDAHR